MKAPKNREGFTLIELLLAITIMGVLAGIVIVAIAPQKMFTGARNVERTHVAGQIERAVYQHLTDKWEMIGDGSVLEGSDNAKPICRKSVSAANCIPKGAVSVNALEPIYLPSIPIDPVMPEDSDCTGYMIYTNAGRPHVYSANVGKLPGDTPEGMCGVGNVQYCNSIEATIVGTTGDDVIAGSILDDVIVALEGDDTITGGDGDDTICGNDGNDTVNGDDDGDYIDGGLGNDVLSGGKKDDTILGQDGSDTLNGDDGKDTLNGGAGDDVLNGGKQNDTLNGGDGTDTCDGGAGNDTEINCE